MLEHKDQKNSSDASVLHQAVRDFFNILNRYDDQPQHLSVYRNFIRQFIRLKPQGNTLPVVEIMSILKAERPNLFYLLKKDQTETFQILTRIEFDAQVARERIQRILQTH